MFIHPVTTRHDFAAIGKFQPGKRKIGKDDGFVLLA